MKTLIIAVSLVFALSAPLMADSWDEQFLERTMDQFETQQEIQSLRNDINRAQESDRFNQRMRDEENTLRQIDREQWEIDHSHHRY